MLILLIDVSTKKYKKEVEKSPFDWVTLTYDDEL